MEPCDHRFGFKCRNITEYYCPLCRVVMDKVEIDMMAQKGEGWWPDIAKESVDEQC